jgi:hypothetical protein
LASIGNFLHVPPEEWLFPNHGDVADSRDWIGERIIIEEPVKMGSTEKEADISIKNANRRTFLYIEIKKRGLSAEGFTEAELKLCEPSIYIGFDLQAHTRRNRCGRL